MTQTDQLCDAYADDHVFCLQSRTIWDNFQQMNHHRLVSLQKRVFRIISKSTFDSHSDAILKELELLELSDIRQLELGKLMFSFNHSLLLSTFNNYFSLNMQASP